MRSRLEDGLIEASRLQRRLFRLGSLDRRHIPAVLNGSCELLGTTPASECQVRLVRRTESGALLVVALVGREEVAVKVGASAPAKTSLASEASVLRALAARDDLASLLQRIPTVLADADVADSRYLITSSLPGEPVAGRGGGCLVGNIAAAAFAHELHQRTGQTANVDDGDVDRWSAEPLEVVEAAFGTSGAVARVEHELRAGLVGREVTKAWVHGDFWGGNVLVSADGAAVLGVVDWELGEPDGLASLDVMHLVMMRRAVEARRMFGDIVCEHLNGHQWSSDDRILFAAGGVSLADAEFERAVLLLAWLRHTAANFKQREDYTRRPIWMRRNVVEVLRVLEATRDARSASPGRARIVA